jgi:hypothetical protein
MQQNENQDGAIDLDALFNWLEQQPELQAIRSQTDSSLCEYRPGEPKPEQRIRLKSEEDVEKNRKGFLHAIAEIVWVPGQAMRGKAYATPELDGTLNSVAKLMSIASLWDFFTTIPLFQFSLSGPLGALSGPAGTLLSFILLWSSNVAGENATDRRKGHASKATWSLTAFLLLTTAKTLFSGVGVDLWIGSRQIASTYAAQLANEKLTKDTAELKLLEISGADFEAARAGCANLEQQMKSLDRKTNEVQYISLYVRAYGSNATTVADRGLTPAQLIKRYGSPGSIPGVCRQRDSLQAINMEKARPLALKLEQKKQDITQKPALIYLQEQEPELFAEHFRFSKNKLEWVNGSEAVGQATNQFYAELLAGHFGILGFSLFTLSISIILTGAAAAMIYLISLNEQVKASFSGELLEYRDQRLDQYQEATENEPYQTEAMAGDAVNEHQDAANPPLAPIGESEAMDARSLRWLKHNARTESDKTYATHLYKYKLFLLWRKYIAETGQTYYPKLRNDLTDRYRLLE